jgi:hypothetical protein
MITIIISILSGLLLVSLIALENVIIITRYKRKLREVESTLTLDLLKAKQELSAVKSDNKSNKK